MSDVAGANTRAARALVVGLAAAGVSDVCISPGSRSTPLTVAFAEQDAIRPWLHLDERSSAFFALGLARASGRPVALVCTSGTAAANFHPAVVEAHLSRIPLVVLTADRPPALRDRGAAQTMHQPGMYGASVRWTQDLPLPSSDAADPRRFEGFAARAVRMAMGPLAGPVHLNIPFEEPLLAPPAAHPAPVGVARGVAPRPPLVAPAPDAMSRVAGLLVSAQRPLIVAGPESGGLPATEIAALAAAWGAPILADALSGLRTGSHDRSSVLDSFDAVLRDPRAAELAPDAVVHFGAALTAKAPNQFLARAGGVPYVLVDAPGGFRDPNTVATDVLEGAPALVAATLGEAFRSVAMTKAGWCARWLALDRTARDAMQRLAASDADANEGEPHGLFEGRVFTELQAALPAGATIVAGNSMPVRDLDSFVVSHVKPLNFVANRGANGIDGVVSSAFGAAAAGAGPVVLVIGDLSFYHDMNGFWAARRHNLDLTVVLVNNDGGGIFHYLPQSAHGELFEPWFGTPSGLDFRFATELHRGTHTVVRDWGAFRTALAASGRGLHVIEVPTDRARNRAMHREAWAAAAEAAFAAEPALV
ncbi:MAG: 2-succinyl-5-enolpyruvyl-6-hydroxy-3-cyclohexene-1-carboxylic-acid synthase [Chloroflexi bacterium]|nr:2-succinyl-5-enolpyruvyl-6-hydroxy-3-cyclohexene-1-carboxylic-acid synthase [Chloroflexota bacterium]